MAMSSRTLLNLALVLAVAALALVIYLQPGAKEEQAGKPLTTLDLQQINQFSLHNENGELQLRRESGAWRLHQPLEIAANGVRAERLLQWLTISSQQSYEAAGLDLASFGLARPLAVLRAGGKELQFGDLDPLNHRRYLLLDGRVHLVAEGDLRGASSPWNYYVSPLIVPAGMKIKGLDIPGLGRISQGEKGWHYEGGNPPSSADALQRLADGWSSASALAVEPSGAMAGGEQVVIEYEGDHPPQRLTLLRGHDGIVLISESQGIEYQLGAEQGVLLLNWGEHEEKGAAQ